MTLTHNRPVLSLAGAQTAIATAGTVAAALGVRSTVTVVGPAMELIAVAKADGATPHSIDSSRRKANAAASTRRATGWMGEELALPLALATDLQLTDILGGVPIVVDGVVVGAIGVAGGAPEQDAQIATEAAARLVIH